MTTRTSTAKKSAPETLEQAVSKISAQAPVIGGLAAQLEEIAASASNFWRKLHGSLPQEAADMLWYGWANALWTEPDGDDDDELDGAEA